MTTLRPDLLNLVSPRELRAELARLSLDLPVSESLDALRRPLRVADRRIPNRFCAQPMEGQDALPDGSPGELTLRRYARYARGGFGLIWVEATAVAEDARSGPAQLHLHAGNVDRFAKLVCAIRQAAREAFDHDVVILLQLAHAGRFSRRHNVPAPVRAQRNPARDAALGIPPGHPLITDAELDRLQEVYAARAADARNAGFDGVDVKSCHNDLVAELAACFTRPGAYGGSFDGRTAFLRQTLARIRTATPELLTATRMSAYDPLPHAHGFGAHRDDAGAPDPAEPIRLAQTLFDAGLTLLNVTTGLPPARTAVGASPDTAPDTVLAACDAEAHPWARMVLEIDLTRRLQAACPARPVVGGGFSGWGALLPFVAAGVLASNGASLAGLGRSALAYPDLPRDLLHGHGLDPARCCIACSACMQLLRDGGPTGCVIRDPEIYGPYYRIRRHHAPDHLREEARRCHACGAAPCSAACPTGIDVPAFLTAVTEDRLADAYRVLRRSNILPELCAHLCPAASLCEGQCIEQTLTGRPVPIREIQGLVCRRARERGDPGLSSVAAHPTGRSIAVVGAGPAGLAASVRLLEKGHRVTLFERAPVLGGLPERVIPAARYPGARDEIRAVLQPGEDAGRLELRLNTDISGPAAGARLRDAFDAVLLAAGLWQELSLGRAEGVVDALTFLGAVKRNEWTSAPRTLAILAGGDSAMDTAVAARALHPADLYILYGGSFADLHWHLSAEWFREPGVHLLMLTDPLGYVTDPGGRLTGLRVCRTAYGPADGAGRRWPRAVPGTESVLPVDLVIEAMGLTVSDRLRETFPELDYRRNGLVRTAGENGFATGHDKLYAAGALVNGGASVCHCIADGMRAAEEIHADV